MHFLYSIPHVNRETLVAFGVGAVIAFVLVGLIAIASRRRSVVLRTSEATDMLAMQIARVADAIDRLAPQPYQRPLLEPNPLRRESVAEATRESSPAPREATPLEEAVPAHHVSMSMLGR